MNRRGFLKVIGQAALAAAIPTAAIAAVIHQESTFTPTLTGVTFTRKVQDFDYGQITGLAASFRVGDDRYRHGIQMPTDTWESLSADQREEAWKLVEHWTYEIAMKRRTS